MMPKMIGLPSARAAFQASRSVGTSSQPSMRKLAASSNDVSSGSSLTTSTSNGHVSSEHAPYSWRVAMTDCRCEPSSSMSSAVAARAL
jgi:hypothetical protein